jgi:anti-sigma factor RsiW
MTCADAVDLIEAVAAGDLTPDAELTAHLAGCPACAAALGAAVRLERTLAARPAPAAPSGFAQRTMAAVRRERWQSEERVDRMFNVTIAGAIVVVILAVVSFFNLGSLAQLALVAVDTLSEVPRQSPGWQGGAPLPVAGLTMAVATLALGVWWWAEHRAGNERV